MQAGRHSAAGNTFLIVLEKAAEDLSEDLSESQISALAISACRQGKQQADGLILGRELKSESLGASSGGALGSASEDISEGTSEGTSADHDFAEADVSMQLYNADGSRAEVSGNGLCCLGQAVALKLGVKNLNLRVSTDAGERLVRAQTKSETGALAQTDMGIPKTNTRMDQEAIHALENLPIEEKTINAGFASVGNPHFVIHLKKGHLPNEGQIKSLAPVIEERTGPINIEFIQVSQERGAFIDMRVWERGVGITSACGTGAVASAAMAREWDLLPPKLTKKAAKKLTKNISKKAWGEKIKGGITVKMPGGAAEVFWGRRFYMQTQTLYLESLEI